MADAKLPAPEITPVLALVNATADEGEGLLERARAMAEPLLVGETFDGGENNGQHAQAMADILAGIGGSPALQAACYLVYACDHLSKPAEVLGKAFGTGLASLAIETHKLLHVQRQARRGMRAAGGDAGAGTAMTSENVRKMLLAFSRDLRVVLLRLASRLQTLRHMAAHKVDVPADLAQESLQVFAPLANRLGIWQLKWELEDLSFRFLEPGGGGHARRKACRARGLHGRMGAALESRFAGAKHPRPGAWAAQTHLQHCQKNARQIAAL
jgi:GTP pyrophosphokinase